ncbi:MAG: glutathione peroxidase [Candidatus Nanopelagicales bacterium]|jgi:glutathione peroxidase|nr:glutathione peroxidase [Candidatus Nanopelagicales bacterium]MCU0298257.1 glutathione peroxidase [Candidatus Nanopelagicales bacterium]
MSIYDFKVSARDGSQVDLAQYKGQPLVIVNTASKCGFTPQFAGLEQLYQEYKDRGLTVIGFPCNQFGNQDPGTNEEIAEFCQVNYGVTFPMMGKIDVNGENADPLYTWLTSQARGFLGTKGIKWNFTKFLIGPDGEVVERFSPQDAPEKMGAAIEKVLA